MIHPDDRERTLACWTAACADQGDYDLEYRIRRHDGEYHWFKTRGVPVRDDSGAIVYWFGTCTDIEDVKRLEAALREADRRKNEFLAILAHELRNPLAPLRTGLQILQLTNERGAGAGPRDDGTAAWTDGPSHRRSDGHQPHQSGQTGTAQGSHFSELCHRECRGDSAAHSSTRKGKVCRSRFPPNRSTSTPISPDLHRCSGTS